MSNKIHVTYTKDHPLVFCDKHLYGILFEVYSLEQEPSAICRHTEQKGSLKRTQVMTDIRIFCLRISFIMKLIIWMLVNLFKMSEKWILLNGWSSDRGKLWPHGPGTLLDSNVTISWIYKNCQWCISVNLVRLILNVANQKGMKSSKTYKRVNQSIMFCMKCPYLVKNVTRQ